MPGLHIFFEEFEELARLQLYLGQCQHIAKVSTFAALVVLTNSTSRITHYIAKQTLPIASTIAVMAKELLHFASTTSIGNLPMQTHVSTAEEGAGFDCQQITLCRQSKSLNAFVKPNHISKTIMNHKNC